MEASCPSTLCLLCPSPASQESSLGWPNLWRQCCVPSEAAQLLDGTAGAWPRARCGATSPGSQPTSGVLHLPAATAPRLGLDHHVWPASHEYCRGSAHATDRGVPSPWGARVGVTCHLQDQPSLLDFDLKQTRFYTPYLMLNKRRVCGHPSVNETAPKL